MPTQLQAHLIKNPAAFPGVCMFLDKTHTALTFCIKWHCPILFLCAFCKYHRHCNVKKLYRIQIQCPHNPNQGNGKRKRKAMTTLSFMLKEIKCVSLANVLPCMLLASIQLISDNNEKNFKKNSAFHGVVGAYLENFSTCSNQKQTKIYKHRIFGHFAFLHVHFLGQWMQRIFVFFFFSSFPFLCVFTVYCQAFGCCSFVGKKHAIAYTVLNLLCHVVFVLSLLLKHFGESVIISF